MNSRQKGAAGIAHTKLAVTGQMHSDWQEIDAENDDGVDGVIFLKYSGNFNGRLIFAQVKSGLSYHVEYKNRPQILGVKIGADYIKSHRPRWDALPGPVILIHVKDPTKRDSKIYWANIKNPEVYSTSDKSVILIKKNETFGSECKGKLKKLAGSLPDNSELQIVDMRAIKSELMVPSFSLRKAREYYRKWASNPTENASLGHVDVTNLGWRHITRKSRRAENTFNSLASLEVARKIIGEVSTYRQLGAARTRYRKLTVDIADILSLRAKVIFRHRAPSPIQVLLQRTRSICKHTGFVKSRLVFLSIHELRRGRTLYYGPD